jgi:hypothetical protein
MTGGPSSMGLARALNGRTTNEIRANLDQMTLISAIEKRFSRLAYVYLQGYAEEGYDDTSPTTVLYKGLPFHEHTVDVVVYEMAGHSQPGGSRTE